MFKELAAIARHTPLHLAITPQDAGRLKVIVTPLPTGKAKDYKGLSKQFSATGTPEELDVDFIAALNTYAGKVTEVRAEVGLPLAELDRVKESSDKKKAKLEAKAAKEAEEKKKKEDAAKKAADTRAAKKAEQERLNKERADKRAEKKAAKAGSGKGIQLPGGTAPALQPAVGDKTLATHLATLPGKVEVLADFREVLAKHGDKARGRKFFVKKSKTGRRYEKLWKNWADFMAEEAQQPLPLEQPAEPKPVELGQPTEEIVEEVKRDQDDAPTGPAKHIAVLERGTRNLLGTCLGEPDVGELIMLTGRAGKFAVDSVLPNVEVIAHEVLAEPFAVMDEEGQTMGTAGEIYAVGDQLTEITPAFADDDWRVWSVDVVSRVYTVRNAKAKYKAFTEDEEFIGEWPSAPKVGEELAVAERAHLFRVLMVDDHRVMVRMILPTKSRIVDHATLEHLGHTKEIYDVSDQVAELDPKDYRVVKVELDAYHVKLSKPRIHGPAAVLSE